MDKQQIKELILELLEDDDIRNELHDIINDTAYIPCDAVLPGSVAIFSSDDND